MSKKQYITEKNITIKNNLVSCSGTYTGEFKKNLNVSVKYSAHGEGTWISNNGSSYQGSWYNDCFDGYGVLTCSNGAIYKGTWRNNEREGFGEYQIPDYTVYNGRWNGDVRHGYGKIIYPDGSVYDGEWDSGFPSGKGKLFNPNGTIQHDGLWLSKWSDLLDDLQIDKNYSNKKVTYLDGSVYDGEFYKVVRDNGTLLSTDGLLFADLRNGQGIMTYSDGSVYDGEWCKDLRKGKGKMIYSDGSVYDGQWDQNVKSGIGKWIFPDGTIQHERWKNDQIQEWFTESHSDYFDTTFAGKVWTAFSGKNSIKFGTVVYKDNSVFEGWIDEGCCLDGIMTYPSGMVYVGEWSEFRHVRCGKHVEITYPDGSIYEGEWNDALIYTEGKMTYPDGSVYIGGLFDGKRQEAKFPEMFDSLSVPCPSTLVSESKPCKQGFGTLTYPDGSIKYKGTWINDEPTTNKPTKSANNKSV